MNTKASNKRYIHECSARLSPDCDIFIERAMKMGRFVCFNCKNLIDKRKKELRKKTKVV